MKNDLISVIVPIYNVEAYLAPCILSIMRQTYPYLEILLIDDGSTDQCPLLCDEFAKKDERIQVIHKCNGGLSNARNTGTLLAKGKYIAFIDSDDYIACTYIEELYTLLHTSHADISVCRYIYVFGEHEDNVDGKTKRMVFDTRDALEVLLKEKEFGAYAHQKLFTSEIAKAHLYPEGKVYEDVATTYLMFHDAMKIAYTQQQLYFYRQRTDSIIAGNYHKQCQFDVIEHVDNMEAFITLEYPELAEFTILPKAFYYLHTMARLPKDRKLYREQRIKIWNYIKKNRWKVIICSFIPKRLKVQMIMTFFGEHFYKSMWHMQKRNWNKRIKECSKG